MLVISCKKMLNDWLVDVAGQIRSTGDAPLRETLKLLGGWPVLDAGWSPPNFGVETLLGRLRGDYNQGVLIEQWVGPDDKNSSVNIIQVRTNQAISSSAASLWTFFLSRGHSRPKRRRQPHFPVSCLRSFRLVFSFDIVPQLWWIFNNFSSAKKDPDDLCAGALLSLHISSSIFHFNSKENSFVLSLGFKFFWAILMVLDLKPLNWVTKHEWPFKAELYRKANLKNR